MRGRVWLAAPVAALAAAFTALPALADDAPRFSLAEAMQDATAMASLGNYLFVTGAKGPAVCAVSVTSRHFAALIDGDDVVAEQTVPGALCVPAAHFTNLAE